MWFDIFMTVAMLFLIGQVFFIFMGVVMVHGLLKEQNSVYKEIVRLNRLYHNS